MSDYTFELAYSRDLTKIGELTKAKDRQLTDALNKAGSFQMRLPLVDDLSEMIDEVTTCVLIKKAQQIKWGGPVWTVNEGTPDTLTVACVGWLQSIEKRSSKPSWGNPLIYSNVDAAGIALDLLARTNTDHTGPNYLFPGLSETTQARTRSYQPYISILDEINSLSTIEAGYDMSVDQDTRELNIYANIGQARDQVLFQYGGNTNNMQRASDTSRMCNRMTAYSAVGVAVAEDADSIATYGLFEEAVSLTDVNDIAILQAYANGEVAVRSTPLRFHTFDPRQHSSATNDPRIYEDYEIGDICMIDVSRGRLVARNQAIRVFGATIVFDDNGQETVTAIQTVAS
jgi:hypothetical protein